MLKACIFFTFKLTLELFIVANLCLQRAIYWRFSVMKIFLKSNLRFWIEKSLTGQQSRRQVYIRIELNVDETIFMYYYWSIR